MASVKRCVLRCNSFRVEEQCMDSPGLLNDADLCSESVSSPRPSAISSHSSHIVLGYFLRIWCFEILQLEYLGCLLTLKSLIMPSLRSVRGMVLID